MSEQKRRKPLGRAKSVTLHPDFSGPDIQAKKAWIKSDRQYKARERAREREELNDKRIKKAFGGKIYGREEKALRRKLCTIPKELRLVHVQRGLKSLERNTQAHVSVLRELQGEDSKYKDRLYLWGWCSERNMTKRKDDRLYDVITYLFNIHHERRKVEALYEEYPELEKTDRTGGVGPLYHRLLTINFEAMAVELHMGKSSAQRYVTGLLKSRPFIIRQVKRLGSHEAYLYSVGYWGWRSIDGVDRLVAETWLVGSRKTGKRRRNKKGEWVDVREEHEGYRTAIMDVKL